MANIKEVQVRLKVLTVQIKRCHEISQILLCVIEKNGFFIKERNLAHKP